MRNKLKTFIFFLFITNILFAQNQVKISRPTQLNTFWTENNLKNVINNGNRIFEQTFWIVRSKSNDISTYDKPSQNRIVQNSLEFLQPAVVKEIKGNMLHIFEYHQANNEKKLYTKKFPNLSNESKDLGWVSIDDVIPSRYPKNDVNASNKVFTEKALCTYVIDPNSPLDVREMHFYKSHVANQKNRKEVQGEHPYYVFAKTENRILLSERAVIDLNSEIIVDQIVGWIPIEFAQIIRTRLCWEPGYGEREEYYRGITFHVDENRNRAKSFIKKPRTYGKNVRGIFQRIKLDKERKNESFNRMYQYSPVLDDVVEVLIIGNVNEKAESLKKEIEELSEEIRNLNILFVMDGTQSMDPYFGYAAEAVEESIKNLETSLKNGVVKSLKVGVGVYRDKKDGEDIYEFMDFKDSKRVSEISSWLKNVECKSAKGDDIPESVFYGLEESIKKFPKNQKNVIILIGDAGNRRTMNSGGRNISADQKINEIVSLSKSYNLNWAVFQIARKGSSTFDYFFDDAFSIIEGTAKNRLKDMGKSENAYDFYYEEETNEETLDLIYANKKPDDHFMFGYVISSNDNQKLSKDLIVSRIKNVIVNMHDNAKEEIIMINQGFNSEPMEDWLRLKGYSEDQIELLQEKTFRVKGYLPIKTDSVYNETFENAQIQVVMLTEKELSHQQDLMSNLAEATTSRTTAEIRNDLRESFIENMILLTGNSNANDQSTIKGEINMMSFNDLWESLFGVEWEHGDDKGAMKVNQLANPDDWSDREIRLFADRISKSANRLKALNPRTYRYKRKTGLKTVNGDNYYLYLERDIYFP